MRILVLGLAFILPAASAAAPAPAPTGSAPEGLALQTPLASPFRPGPMPLVDPNAGAREDCPPISRYHAQRREPRPDAQKLNELPMADHYKAAYRLIDGCEAPIVASFGAGRSR